MKVTNRAGRIGTCFFSASRYISRPAAKSQINRCTQSCAAYAGLLRSFAMLRGSAEASVNRYLLFWKTSPRSGESMTVAARKKYTKPKLGRMTVHFERMTCCVTFHLGAMMIGAHSTEMATLENWKGPVKTSGEMSGKAMFGSAAVACRGLRRCVSLEAGISWS